LQSILQSIYENVGQANEEIISSISNDDASHAKKKDHNNDSRKRKQIAQGKAFTNNHQNIDLLRNEVLNAATEYAMLHFGGSKYRKKRILVSSSVSEEINASDSQKAHEQDRDSDREQSNDSNVHKVNDINEELCNDSNTSQERQCENIKSTATSFEFITDKNPLTIAKNDKLPIDLNRNKVEIAEKPIQQTIAVKIDYVDHLKPDSKLCHACKHVSSIEGELYLDRQKSSGSFAEERNISIYSPLFLPSSASSADDRRSNRAIGRWGEALVYNLLLDKYPNSTVEWLNINEESNASYGFKLISRSSGGSLSTRFIEVKSTKYSAKNVFQFSLWEWDFIQSHPRPNYDIYRVYNAGDPEKVKVVIYYDVYKLLLERKIELCLAV
jgi:hypothetical protein